MDTAIFLDQNNKPEEEKAKCLIKIPTVIYKSESSFPEEDFFLSLEFEVINKIEGSEETIQLSLESARYLADSIQIVITKIEELLKKNIQSSEEVTNEIIYYTNWSEKFTQISDLHESKKRTDANNLNIEVYAYQKHSNSYYYVSLCLDDEHSNYFLSKNISSKIQSYLEKSIRSIENNPPRLVSNFHVGHVLVLNSQKKIGQVELEIEGAIFDENSPCIAVNITENLDKDDIASTWWISDNEALVLSNFLSDAINSMKMNKTGDIGKFYENDLSIKENKYPWLSVKIEQHEMDKFIQITLDDELIRESESVGILLLKEAEAEKLSQLLRSSLQAKVKYPPYVYKTPEPEYTIVAEIY